MDFEVDGLNVINKIMNKEHQYAFSNLDFTQK